MTRAKSLLLLISDPQPQLDHTELKYIESSGGQYIDTGVNASNTIKTEIKWRVLNVTNQGYILGSATSTNKSKYCIQRNANALISQYNSVNTTISTDLTINSDYIIVRDGNLVYLNGALVQTDDNAIFNNQVPLYLFARNLGGIVGVYETIRLYYCKIWDAGKLVRDFIPVRESGVICMYDKVTQTYFYGIGSFLGG